MLAATPGIYVLQGLAQDPLAWEETERRRKQAWALLPLLYCRTTTARANKSQLIAVLTHFHFTHKSTGRRMPKCKISWTSFQFPSKVLPAMASAHKRLMISWKRYRIAESTKPTPLTSQMSKKIHMQVSWSWMSTESMEN